MRRYLIWASAAVVIGASSAGAQNAPPPADGAGIGETTPGTIVPAGPEDAPGAIEVGAIQYKVSGGEEKKRGDLIIAPVPFSNPTIGSGLGGGVGYIFRPNRNDVISPPSILLIGGLASSNGTRGVFLGGNLFLSEDRYRIQAGVAHIDARYDFYGVGSEDSDLDIKVPLRQRVDGFLAQGLFRVAPRLYAGLRYLGGKSRVTIRGNGDSVIGRIISRAEFDTKISSLGLRLQGDSRNSAFFPTRGYKADVKADFHSKSLGDDFDFQVYYASYRAYIGLGATAQNSGAAVPSPNQPPGTRQVVALSAQGRTVSGKAPFFSLSQVGSQDGLRGYVSGKYRDKTLLSAQAEYRQTFPNRFGFVAFAGGSAVFPNFGDLSGKDFLGAVGVGARYRLSKENPVNYRVDYAYGKDGGNLYFAVGEDF